MKTTKDFRRSNSGFTLLEVLIAILVTSFGILGVASLQITGLKESQSSYQRSQAVMLAYEIADRMYSERTQAALGHFAIEPDSAAPTAARNCIASLCDADELAAYDLSEWDQRVRSMLPSGKTRIECVGRCGTALRQEITVMWDDSRSGSAGTGCNKGDLACFRISVAP